MLEPRQHPHWRWAGLAAAITLMTLSLILVGSLAAAAQEPLGPTGLEADPFDLTVNTWHMTEGTPAQSGGVTVYGIWYANIDGPGTAPDVQITDLLPPGTTFLGDSTGFPVHYDDVAGTVTWELGAVEPGQNGILWVTLGIEAPASTVLDPNQVAIAPILDDLDPGNNEGSSGPVDVIDPVDIDLSVGKRPQPGDPMPGELFQYEIGWCNHSEVAVGPVTLIDTLPDGVHYVDRYLAQPWQDYWNLVGADDSQVVLEAPGVPGNWCQEIYLVLRVDETIEISNTLTNTVEIHVDGDVNPENDVQISNEAHVSPPRPDLGMEKNFAYGVLVPGASFAYGINFWNQGNVEVNAFLTDTLPAVFTYVPGSTRLSGEPFADPAIDGQELTWDLGPVAVNGGADLSFEVDIDAGAPTETTLVNCAEIGHALDDASPWDNESCVGVELWPSGANLHVEKWSQWNRENIHYWFFAANLGDVPVPGVVIVDTYPEGTMEAEPPTVPEHLQHKTEVVSGPGQWAFEIDDLQPGEGGWFDFYVNVVEPDAKPAEFLNVIEITPTELDVNPADNHDEDLLVIPEIDRVELFLEPDGQSSMWGVAVPGQVVTVTTPSDVFTTTAGMDECDNCWQIEDTGIVNEGEEITVEAAEATMPVVFTVPDPFTAVLDRSADTVSGQIDHLDTEPVEVRGWWEGGWQQVMTNGAGEYEAVYGDPIPPGAEGVTYYETMVDYTQVTYRRHFRDMSLILQVNYDHDWIQGGYEAGHTIWLTVTQGVDIYTTSLTSDYGGGWEDGGFNSDWGEWHPERPNIQPGDLVEGEVDNGYTAMLTVGAITGSVDAENDSIAGTVHAEWLPTDEVDVECHPWGAPGWAPNKWSTAGTDGDPPYSCQWNPADEWDVLPGQDIAVSYYEPFGHQVFGVFSAPWMRVNYAHDWVGGNYPLGYTFVISVTESDGVTEKGVAEAEVTPDGGWGGSGFETQWDNWLGGRPPDIVPGDLVHFFTDGYENTVQVGDIGGVLDVGGDSISGPVHAESFGSELLDVRCELWVPQGPEGKDSSAGADGDPEYACSWSGEWDIQPGDDVAVMYVEPDDGDRVINVFHEPVPDMSVDKRPEGGNQFAPGGRAVFWINYSNDGDAVADPAILVDTLPAGVIYLEDTSGFTPDYDDVAGTVTWELGAVAPGEGGGFTLLVELPDPAPEELTNVVDIFAEFDPNEDNNHSEATIYRTEPYVELYVNKNPSPGDPTPGSTYLYEIHYGNSGATASGEATLTDLLPNDPVGCTSVVDWYSANGYGFWTEVSRYPNLVLTAPTLPAEWGDRLILRLKVEDTCPLETQLVNEVILEAPPADPASHVNEDAWTSGPYTDAYLDKQFGWGTLVPGGEIGYNLHVANQGNLTATITLTDTLPAGTSFVESWSWDGRHYVKVVPAYISADEVSWNLGEMPPGAWINIDLRLDIAPSVGYDEVLTNCAEIVVAEGDAWPMNNTACRTDAVREEGANLRIYKDYRWNGPDQLHYEITFQNIGTETLLGVEILDTLPDHTVFNGEWGADFDQGIDYDPLGLTPRWIIAVLEPGWTGRIEFNVDLEPAWIGVQGEAYTNLAVADVDGDVWPEDNTSVVTAYTGPDIFIEKWLSGGEVRPGEIVTFTVQFGNHNLWPWGTDPAPPDPPTTITDILPDELTFVTATAPWNPEEEWLPDEINGNSLSWGFGPMDPGSWWTFQIVAEVSEDAEADAVIVNTVQAHSNSLNDVDPLPGNNSFDLYLTVLPDTYPVYLPLVLRKY